MNNYPQSCRSKTQPNLEYLWQKASQTETETKSWSTSSHGESGQCKAALPSRLPWCRQRVVAVCEQAQAVHCATPPPTRCLATASADSTHLSTITITSQVQAGTGRALCHTSTHMLPGNCIRWINSPALLYSTHLCFTSITSAITSQAVTCLSTVRSYPC